jgi:hypothetical protein
MENIYNFKIEKRIHFLKIFICFVNVETDPPVLGDVKVALALGLTSIYTGTMVKNPILFGVASRHTLYI